MDVELLYVDDCPNWRQTADLLDDLAAELAFTWSAVLVTLPRLRRRGFHGSPASTSTGSTHSPT